jgi:hypothetical protein
MPDGKTATAGSLRRGLTSRTPAAEQVQDSGDLIVDGRDVMADIELARHSLAGRIHDMFLTIALSACIGTRKPLRCGISDYVLDGGAR